VYRRGQTIRTGVVSLKYIRNQREEKYRVAVVVSRKVSKSAVVRNRIRRRVYEIVRKEATYIGAAYDLVFFVYDESVATVSHAQLEQAIIGSLERAKVLNRSERAIVENKETLT